MNQVTMYLKIYSHALLSDVHKVLSHRLTAVCHPLTINNFNFILKTTSWISAWQYRIRYIYLGNLFQYPVQCILVEMSWIYNMCINETVNSIQLLLFCGQNDDLLEKQQLLFYYMTQRWVDVDISNILSVNV